MEFALAMSQTTNIHGTDMSYEEAFGPYEAHYKSIILHNVWGHLFPDQIYYEGAIRLAGPMYGAHGSVVIIDESESLPGSSPWWYDAICGFAEKAGGDLEAGQVIEVAVAVSIVQCEEEPEQWLLDEGDWEPDTWTEIHISQMKKTMLLENKDV